MPLVGSTLRYAMLAAISLLIAACGQVEMVQKRHLGKEPVQVNELAASDQVSGAANAFFSRASATRVAVTSFEDQSGARIENGASSAIAASGKMLAEYILMTANGQNRFQVMDRTNVNQLLDERRLAAQVNQRHEADVIRTAPDAVKDKMKGRVPPLIDLPELQPSDFLISGAVVGYDKRLQDDGTGVGIAGLSSNSRQSRDQVNVIIHLIDVRTGQIIATGFSAQFIDSTAVTGGIFKLLSVDRLLEFEKTNLLNDPTTFALFRAIDAALTEMFENA